MWGKIPGWFTEMQVLIQKGGVGLENVHLLVGAGHRVSKKNLQNGVWTAVHRRGEGREWETVTRDDQDKKALSRDPQIFNKELNFLQKGSLC